MSSSTDRHPLRIVVVSLCAIALAAAFVVVLRQSLAANAGDFGVVERERSGVVFLHPMTGLVGRLVEAQSAAVRGEKVDDAAVRKSLSSMAVANGKVHGVLGTDQRFTDLRRQVEAALDGGGTGRAAYQTYTDVIAITLELLQRVGDSSSLVHDPDLDSYYLMDSALVHLPAAMVYAGRAADLVALAGTTQLAGEDAVKAAVARYGVAASAEKVSAGLNKSIDNTARAALGANIAPQLDAFRAAADVFAPPTMIAQLAGEVNASDLAKAAHEVFTAALPLAHKLLSELDAVLAVRENSLGAQRRSTLWAGAGVVLVVVVALLMFAFTRARPRSRRSLAEAGVGPADRNVGDIALGSAADLRRLLDDDDDLTGAAQPARWGPQARADAR